MTEKFPLLITLTHCSNVLPPAIEVNLTLTQKEVEDYLDPGSGALFQLTPFHILPAQYSRLYVDLNRAPDHAITLEDRKGVILETTYWNQAIYKRPVSTQDRKERLDHHQHYFQKLKDWIKTKNIQFLIGGHTMYTHPLIEVPTERNKRPDICLSNRDFNTCNQKTTEALKAQLEAQGYKVEINSPFNGGHLIHKLCDGKKLQGLQLEFRFGLIGNEETREIDSEKLKEHQQKIERALLNFWESFIQ